MIWGDLTKNGLGRMGKDDEEYGLYCLTSQNTMQRVSHTSLHPPTTQQHEVGNLTFIFIEENETEILRAKRANLTSPRLALYHVSAPD